MRSRAFKRHLREHGCAFVREGANHEIWTNLENGRRTAVPRHREIADTLCRVICDQLGIPAP